MFHVEPALASIRAAGLYKTERIITSPLSEQISRELKRRGFKFVGPTIVYAWMQAVGLVNDHSTECFRRDQV